VAEVLKSAGYQTGGIGTWGLGLTNSTGTPHRQGFDEWLGYLDPAHAEDYYPAYLWRSSVQNNVYDHALVMDGNLDGRRQVYAHDFFTMAATNFIRISKYQPFFLYLAFTIPHANQPLTKKTGNGMEVPDDAPYTNKPWPQPEKNKAAMITRLDHSVGLILQQLTRLKLDTNTILFFTSDNGPHQEGGNDPRFFKSSGPWRGQKHDLYEGGIRVPMIVRWPGHIAAGTVSDQIWAFWDFLPTAAALAGAKPPENLDGLSVFPALLGQKPTNQHPYLYWECPENGFKQALRIGDWKAVRQGQDQPWELYNLKSDLQEQHNLASQHPDLLQKIETVLKTARSQSPEG
jgi:arylsulfatase A-like enzyme